MIIVGRDYILKILNQEYIRSVFDVRKKYFVSGEPRELGKNSTIFFVMKNPETKEYDLVGEANPTFVGPLVVRNRDEDDFSEEHGWRFVIELTNLRKYLKSIPVTIVFSPDTTKKLHAQRPYGVQLSAEEGRSAKVRIEAFSFQNDHSP